MDEKENILTGVPLTQGERQTLIDNARLGSAGLKLALATLHSFMGNAGAAFPSYDALAKRMCCDASTAKRRIARLKVEGFLRSVRRRRKDGGWSSNDYEIMWDRLLDVQVDDMYARVAASLADTAQPEMADPPLAQNATRGGSGEMPQGASGNLPPPCGVLPLANRQTDCYVEEKREEVSGERAVCLSVPDRVSESQPSQPKLLHPAEKLRRITKAAGALRTAGVWPNVISDLLTAAEDETGDPLPRVLQVLEAAERGKHTAKWIRSAIEDGWELSERQLVRDEQDIERRRMKARTG